MSLYWLCLAACLLSAGAVMLLTPVVKAVALEYEWLDVPSARKVHCESMVRLGGIAIFVATVFSAAVGLKVLAGASLNGLGLVILLGGGGFFLIGLADDLLSLSAMDRLQMQCVVATVVWWFGIRIEMFSLPGLTPVLLTWLSLPLTILWLAGVVNAFNWMDGLDGLAAGVAGIGTCAIVVIGMVTRQPTEAVVGAALLGSLLGFLYYNVHPAKIFMGDGGSYFVGFMLASLCVVESQSLVTLSEYPLASLLPLAILALPLGDMCGVILTRLFQGISPFEADNRHLHHRLMRMGFSHPVTVWVMYGLAAIAAGLSLVMMQVVGLWLWLCGLVALGAVVAGQMWLMQRAGEDTSERPKKLNVFIGE